MLPPKIALPAADKAVAKQFGISERMVRKIRSDKRMQPFMPHPVWQVRDWVRRGAEDHAARARAKQLMTPERYAKNERVALVSAGLAVEQGQECFCWDGSAHRLAHARNGRLQPPRPRQRITDEDVYRTALAILRFLRRLEEGVPSEHRRRPQWLGFQLQWARIEARCEGWFFRNDRQVYVRRQHPEGRRIIPKFGAADRGRNIGLKKRPKKPSAYSKLLSFRSKGPA